MRETLFRGKRKDNGEWVEGYLFDDGLTDSVRMFIGSLIIEDYKGLSDDQWDITGTCFYEVIPETVGQYTGLDINSTKVFDGDIIDVFPSNRKMYVLFNEETLAWEIADVGTKPCEVNHLVNCMSLGELGVEACFENDIRSKVIGNIYDNPDLTEVKHVREAIKHFESLQKRYTTQHNGKQCEYVKTALKAMRKRDAQKTKKIPYMYGAENRCPSCNHFVGWEYAKHTNFCEECGQALDWSKE